MIIFNRTKNGKMFLVTVFILGIIYLILPGPGKIEDFSPLPASVKSTLEGDTIQNPNIAAYYSDFRRFFITWFYQNAFAKMHIFGKIFPIITINHPPEKAYQYIRDQQESTFLEEYVYLLRYSFFVNGYEPMMENQMYKKPSNDTGNHIILRDKNTNKEKFYDSKTTIRFYPTNPLNRIFIYLGIWLAAFALYKLALRAIKE